MTLRYSSRRIEASLDLGATPVRLWAGARTVVHEGVAAVVEAHGPQRCQQIAQQARAVAIEHDGPGPGPLWLGGMSFDEQHAPIGPWKGFPAARFRLPARQVVMEGDEAFETLLVGPGIASGVTGRAEREAVLGAARDVEANGGEIAPGLDDASGAFSEDAQSFLCTDQAGWTRLVDDARRAIHAGGLTKVVAARVEPLPRIDVRQHALGLRGEGTVFLFEEAGATFYGSTPETLVRLQGQGVETHALAGSAAGGSDGAALLASEKDVLEHELVAAFVRERLVEAGVRDVHQGSRGLRRLRHVQHLETPVEGRAPKGAHVLDLAASLHPTPAVCGTPRRRSREWIRENEGWPRGWYAGAVGWFDAGGEGELSVALRCALQDKDGRYAFAGAGIVAGSEPGAEWLETEAKLATMREGG